MVRGIGYVKPKKRKPKIERDIENVKDLTEAGRLIGMGIGEIVRPKKKKPKKRVRKPKMPARIKKDQIHRGKR